MKNAFVIVRVSAEDQLKGYGPDVQWEDDILPNSPILGLSVTEAHRRVIQESATGWERPKFESAVREAMALHVAGEIDALMFPRVDRESRFVFGSFPLLTEVIRSGLRVYFAREKLALDPNDPESVERYLNKATQAQAYVQTMKSNTSRAKQKLLRDGKLPQGTGVGCYGYQWNRATKKRDIIPAEAEIVKEIFSKVAAGQSLISIAMSLNERGVPTKGSSEGQRKFWYSLTVRRLVKNAVYTGKTYFGVTSRVSKSRTVTHPQDKWSLLPDVSPVIIGQDLFDRANAELDKPKVRTGHPKNVYLLANHVFCAVCGRPMVGHCLGGKYRYYQCSDSRPHENFKPTCKSRYVRADDLEAVVWDSIKRVLSKPEVVIDQIQKQLQEAQKVTNATSIDAQIDEIRQRLPTYKKRRENLLQAIEIDGFEKENILERLNAIKRSLSEDDKRLGELTELKANVERLHTAKVQFEELYAGTLQNVEHSTDSEKRKALRMLNIKVRAQKGEPAKIEGIIPVSLPTTEQTSALPHTYSCPRPAV